MSFVIRSALVVGLAFSALGVTGCRETESPAPKPTGGPKWVEYDKVFVEFNGIVKEMRGLMIEFESARPARQQEIEARYEELTEEGTVVLEELIQAATAAEQEEPGKDPQVVTLLLAVLQQRIGYDDYENALPLANILIESGTTPPEMYAIAGQAAFALAEFDTAREFFEIAEENSTLSDVGKSCLASIPYLKEAWPKEQEIRAKEAEADDLPRVKITTEHGETTVELFENEAPNTVANFITLVEKGFYDGLTFHRVLPMFMAQGGCPEGNGSGDPGYNIPCECVRPDHRMHFRGSLSMAKMEEPDTGGCQFFINFVPTPQLDGRHTVFGRVIEGIEVLSKIPRIDPDDDKNPMPVDPGKIVKMEVIRKRDHEYVVKKAGM